LGRAVEKDSLERMGGAGGFGTLEHAAFARSRAENRQRKERGSACQLQKRTSCHGRLCIMR
jgi:hypothetical protein